jgi:hypothetical protein
MRAGIPSRRNEETELRPCVRILADGSKVTLLPHEDDRHVSGFESSADRTSRLVSSFYANWVIPLGIRKSEANEMLKDVLPDVELTMSSFIKLLIRLEDIDAERAEVIRTIGGLAESLRERKRKGYRSLMHPTFQGKQSRKRPVGSSETGRTRKPGSHRGPN